MLIVILSLTLTALATTFVATTSDAEAQARFEKWTHQVEDDIQDRIDRYVALLRGAAGLLAAQPDLSAPQFRAFVDRLDINRNYPGIRGIGYAPVITADQRPALIASMKQQGLAQFNIWPDGQRDRYAVITYIQPLDERNSAALGFDMMSEPIRRAAMEAAVVTGHRAASGRVHLVQEIDSEKQPGFLIYVACYEGGRTPATVQERWAKLRGFVYAPFRMGELLAGIYDKQHPYIAFNLYDTDEPTPEHLMYRSDNDGYHKTARFSSTEQIDIAGRPWTAMFCSRPPFEAEGSRRWLVELTLVGGMAATLVIFAVSRGQARARDVAERSTAQLLRSQESLRLSEERYRLVARATNDVIWDWDLVNHRLTWNESIKDAFGYELADIPPVIGWWQDRVHPDDREAVLRELRMAIESGAQTWSAEYRFRCVDGDYAHVLDRGFVTRDRHGNAVRMIGAMFDLSVRKRAEEQLRTLNETLEERVASRTAELLQQQQRLRSLAAQLTQTEQRERRRLAQVLHDHLQQLLVAATMRTSMMKRKLTGDSADSAQQILDLLNRSIEASRSLTVELSPPVLYDAGLIAALNWLGGRMKDKYGLTVEVDADPDAEPTAEDVRITLFQAAQELLFNIAKHAQVNTTYVTLMRLADGRLKLAIEDEGRGFDMSRPPESSADSSGGFGLFNLRERLQMLGGSISIESSPGEGTCVEIITPGGPVEAEAQPPAAPQFDRKAPALHDADGKIRVLLADDHKILRDGLAALLREEPDIEVVGEAADGAIALDLARQTQPDLVIMDVTMPNMNGIEATRRLSTELPHIRVIGLSMHDDTNLASAMREAGAVAYLPKDGPSNLLMSTIRNVAHPHAA
jgi:PAS domain S-box-containing protein